MLTQDNANVTTVSVAPVAADRTIHIGLRHLTVNFVDTLEKIDPHLQVVGSPAVLLKLNGRLDTRAPKMEVVVPANKQSKARF